MASSVIELERLVVRLTGDASDYLDMLSKAENSTRDFVKRIEGQLAAVSVGFAAPLAGVGAGGLKAFADFDQGMKKALAIMPATEAQIKQMRDTVLDLSGKTLQGPAELSNAFYTLASAGMSVEQSIAALPAVAQFATAGVMDLKQATYLAVTAQGALGLRAENAQTNVANLSRVMNVLSRANMVADATTEDFVRAITSQAGVTFRAFGKDIEECAAVLAVYSQQGIKAEVAGTNLSRVTRLLGEAAEKNSEQFKALGVSVFEGGKMRNIADIVENLEKVLGPMSAEMRIATLSVLGFNARIQQAIFPLLGTSAQIRKNEKDFRSIGDTTKQVADKYLTSFTNQMTMLGNQVKVVGVEIGEILAPYLTQLGNIISEAMRWVRSLSLETKQWVVQNALVAVGIISLATSLMAAANIFTFFFSGLYGMVLGLILVVSVSETARKAVVDFALGLLNTYSGFFKVLGGVVAIIVALKIFSGILAFTGIQQVALTAIWVAWGAIVLAASAAVMIYNAAQALLNAMVTAATGLTWAYVASLAIAILDMLLWTAGIVGLVGVLGLSLGVLGAFITAGLVVTGVMTGLAVMFALVAASIVVVDKLLVLSSGILFTYRAGWLATQIMVEFYRARLVVTAAIMTTWNAIVGSGTVLMKLWAVACLFADGVQWLFNAANAAGLAIWQGLNLAQAASVIGTGLWATVTSLAEAICWTFNAALGVMNIELAPVTILAAIAAMLVLVGVFILAASAAYGIYEAMKATVTAVLSLSTTAGPIAHIAGLFKEWWGILLDVYRLSQEDMPRAWKTMQAAFELAVSQIRDLWPPLWIFIKEGFIALWDLVVAEFETKFQQALINFTAKWAKLSSFLGLGLGDQIDKKLKELNDEARAQSQNNLNYAKGRLETALSAFGTVEESAATQEKRAALEFFRGGLVGPRPEAIPGLDDKSIEAMKKKFGELGEEGGAVLHKGLGKEIQRFEAALSHSAEAITRLEEYKSRIEAPESVYKGKIGIELPKRFDATDVKGAEGKTREEEMLEQLKKINEAVRLGLKKPGVPVAPADL